MQERFCGIDFGTTNSTVGLIAAGGQPVLLPLEGDEVTLPSALFFSFEDHETYFGRAAISEYRDGAEGRFMRALKSVLGSALMSETTQIGRQRLRFDALIGIFLGHLRDHMSQGDKEPPQKVVLGRPVFFVDGDEKADRAAEGQLRSAASAQGFAHIEFQFEPVAAALHFEQSLSAESLALVVDIGGGTSDFSILRLSPERARASDRISDILSTSGVHVGGTDFDKQLSLAEVMPELGRGSLTADGKRHLPQWYFQDMATWHRINQLYTPKILREVSDLQREAAEPEKLANFIHLLRQRSGHRLASVVEAAKIALSDSDQTTITLHESGLALAIPTTRSAFERAVNPLIERIGLALDETVTASGVTRQAIETIILTGGGAQVPSVLAAVRSRFPEGRIFESDRFGAVGLGLALDAARRFG